MKALETECKKLRQQIHDFYELFDERVDALMMTRLQVSDKILENERVRNRCASMCQMMEKFKKQVPPLVSFLILTHLI